MKWKQIKPDMTNTEAYLESSRCLYCYDAPCIQACPTEIDIPLFIRQINNKNTTGAAKTIYASNYFGNICGKVCPTEVLCEGACVYNKENTKPIEIGRLQSYATSAAFRSGAKVLATTQKTRTQKVAIIGAGPSGLSCAYELSLLGYEVEVFEARAKASGLVLYACAPYKIINEEIQEELDYLTQQSNFKIHYEHPIQKKDQVKDLEENFDAIFLGIGLGETRQLSIPGINLKNCFGATEFIEKIKLNNFPDLKDKKVVVIGAGNTAMDAASESALLGAKEVTIAYRKGKEKMPAYYFEYELAKGVEVKGLFNVVPKAILGRDQLRAIQMARIEVKNGEVKELNNTTFTLDCDFVILATGQHKQKRLVNELFELETDAAGRILVNKDTLQASCENYFAAGDAVNGGAEVVNACAGGKKAGQAIHEFFNQ